MKYKKCTYYLLFVIAQMVFAYPSFADTISIENITIQAIREHFYSSQNNTYKIDSFSKVFYGNNNLSELLQNSTNVLVNSYGLGASSTISMRGTADDQTAILWNGINIRSITLGSTDVSIIPIQALDNISIVTNSASSIYGSGTFGGAILINNEPNWKNKLFLNTQYIFGSYKQHYINENLQLGNTKVQFQSNAIFQKAENDFWYKDVYLLQKPIRQIQHNALQNWAVVNNLFAKFKKQQFLNIGFWIQQKEKEFPATMGGSLESSKIQKDFTSKNYVLYKKIFSKSILYNRLSAIYDYQNYTDKLQNIDATYSIYRISNSLNYRFFPINNLIFDFGADYFFDKAKVTEYKKSYAEHRAALFFGAKYQIKNFSFNSTIRQEISKRKYIRPLFGFDVAYTSSNNRVYLNLNYADKFRLPDFNDKYWTIGGNPNLIPEKGYTVEFNTRFNLCHSKNKNQFYWTNAYYYSKIIDNIVWTPLTSTYWQPRNVKNTQHFGIESKLEYKWQIHPFLYLQTNVNYAFNKSTILKDITPATEGKLLRYKPMHKLQANFLLDDKYFSFGLNYNYTAKRFTDDENSTVFQLPSYHLIDILFTYKLYFNKIITRFTFQINNIGNTTYESIRSYAQPLRNYKLTFQINYSK
jgi:vitamin B12 transporter